MRFLAIDPGDKRCGMAVGDDILRQASPVGVVEASTDNERLEGLLAAIEEHGPNELVMGLPYNMDGSESPGVTKAKALGAMLSAETGMPVHFVDERLTSFEADDMMKMSGLTHKQKKKRRDTLAATVILQDFLNTVETDH